MSATRVLVVEDDASSADILTHLLEHHQMRVSRAATGESAMQMLNENDYDLIIIDLALPGVDGWQVFDHLQSLPHLEDSIAVALTAYYTPFLAQEARRKGFAAAYPKPVTKALMASLGRLLDSA